MGHLIPAGTGLPKWHRLKIDSLGLGKTEEAEGIIREINQMVAKEEREREAKRARERAAAQRGGERLR